MTKRGGEMAGLLAAAMDRLLDLAPSDLPMALSAVGAEFGISEITLYLAELQQALLVPWGYAEGGAEDVQGSAAGRAFQRGEPVGASTRCVVAACQR